MSTLYAKAEIRKEADGKILMGIASTEAEDRQGEIVELSGWDLSNAEKNCPLLWAHKHDEPAIGTVKKLWIDGEKDGVGKGKLMFNAFISDATERGRAIKQLIEENVIKTFSVGFRGLDMQDNRFTKQELLEISVVNVPANPDALVLSYKSLHEQGISDQTITELGIPAEFIKRFEVLEEKVSNLQSAKEIDTSAPQVETKKVVGRITILKGMVSKTDDLLAREKTGGVPKGTRLATLKLLKKNTDVLIASIKKDLNGTN